MTAHFRGLSAGAALLSALLSALPLAAADLSADVQRRLAENPLLTEFRLHPEGLTLLPAYGGAQDFGTVRFRVRTEVVGDGIELRMVNLDPLKYLIFPAVPPRRALVDLVYLPGPERSLLYTAWSVRSYVFIPAAAGVQVPLRRRALALKDWFVHLMTDHVP